MEGILLSFLRQGHNTPPEMFFDSLQLIATETNTPFGSAMTKMSEFREIGGIMTPFVMEMDMGPMGVHTISVRSFEVNTDISPEILAEMAGK